MNVLTTCAILLTLLLAGILLKQTKPEYAPLLACAGAVLLGARLLTEWTAYLASLSSLAAFCGQNGMLALLIKALGAATACTLTADLCKDCGEFSLASRAELFGKLAILSLTAPVVLELLSSL
ncbi:MAG: stage III sporulation AC/AD family protein [Clostridiales bacterium]|nr:stage III sporulation AC/AD family protein [Candidatus Coliplasma caballi]